MRGSERVREQERARQWSVVLPVALFTSSTNFCVSKMCCECPFNGFDSVNKRKMTWQSKGSKGRGKSFFIDTESSFPSATQLNSKYFLSAFSSLVLWLFELQWLALRYAGTNEVFLDNLFCYSASFLRCFYFERVSNAFSTCSLHKRIALFWQRTELTFTCRVIQYWLLPTSMYACADLASLVESEEAGVAQSCFVSSRVFNTDQAGWYVEIKSRIWLLRAKDH